MQTDKWNFEQLGKVDCYKRPYHTTFPEDKGKEEIVKNLVDVGSNQVEIDGFDREELDEILEFIYVE